MGNKIILDNNDIDLINLIKVIWDKRLLIFLVTFLSLIVSIGAIINDKNKIKPKTYNFERVVGINLLTDSELLYFERINNLIRSTNVFSYNLNRKMILKKINDKILNLTQSFIKNNIYFQNRMSKLKNDEFNIQLNNYTKLFILEDTGDNYNLKFYWDNQFESQKILEDYFNYLSADLKNEIFENLDYILLKFKEIQNKEYKIHIDYLIGQSDIAKKMGIEYPTIMVPTILEQDVIEKRLVLNKLLNPSDVYDFTFDHGYKVINAQIEKLKNQKNLRLEILNNEINILKNNQNINWVNYFLISAIEKKADDKSINIIIISTTLGLIIGVILALILNSVKFKRKT